MSDITSARLLGRVFKQMAVWPTPNLAYHIYMQEVPNGDFSAYQMEADPQLVVLGLAREMTQEELKINCVDRGFIYAHEKGF